MAALFALGQIDRLDDEAGGPVPGVGVELAVGHVPQGGTGLDDVDDGGVVGRLTGVGDGVDRVRVGADGGDGPAQRVGVTDDHGTGVLAHLGVVQQGLGGDLRSDPGHVPEGDGKSGTLGTHTFWPFV